MIGDPRNVEISIVSQFQGLVFRFLNRMVADDPGLEFPDDQRMVCHHYQYVVAKDFLPRFLHSTLLAGFKTKGHYDRKNLKSYHPKNDPFMPVEISVAAYRLGHSMIRLGYPLNEAT